MSKWVLVPVEPTDAMSYVIAAGHAYDASDDWEEMLAARPPIPRSVWDAMVERAYVALWTNGKYNGIADALRAALGNPMVEGDEG